MTARTAPSGLAPLLQLLELEQPRVVTVSRLTTLAQEAGVRWPPHLISQRLRERGWLLPLATKGVWEFAPAARAGAFGSGDPLIELRAVLARDPAAPFVVAAESAAFLLGLASRRPAREVIGAPEGTRPPKALRGTRLVRWRPAVAPVVRDGLPTWSSVTLLAFMAARPSGYRDWPNVGEWLAQVAAQATADDVASEVAGRPRGAWARAAYLLHRAGADDAAATLMARAPAGKGPYYLGDRGAKGRYDKTYDVVDSTRMEVGDE